LLSGIDCSLLFLADSHYKHGMHAAATYVSSSGAPAPAPEASPKPAGTTGANSGGAESSSRYDVCYDMFQSSFEPDVYNAKKSSSSIDLLVSSSFGAHSCASCKFCTCQIQQNFLYGCALWQAESRSQCHDVVSPVFFT